MFFPRSKSVFVRIDAPRCKAFLRSVDVGRKVKRKDNLALPPCHSTKLYSMIQKFSIASII